MEGGIARRLAADSCLLGGNARTLHRLWCRHPGRVRRDVPLLEDRAFATWHQPSWFLRAANPAPPLAPWGKGWRRARSRYLGQVSAGTGAGDTVTVARAGRARMGLAPARAADMMAAVGAAPFGWISFGRTKHSWPTAQRTWWAALLLT